MADNVIRGIIQIDGGQAQQALFKFEQSLSNTEKSFKKFTPSANQAGNALNNLGRVAQDAPFGFISIQNNINPLIESFQSLKKETGSTGGALKALVSSLTGAGGVGLAFSIAAAAATFAANGFGAWTRGLNNVSKEAKKLAKDIEDAADRITEITSKSLTDISNTGRGSVEANIAQIQALSNAVLDQTKSYKERNNALNELKNINKTYFGDLSLEESSLRLLTQRVEEYTNAIIAASVTKAFADEIGNASKELFEQINIYNKLGKAADDAKRRLDATQRTKIVGSAGGGLEVVTAEYNKAQKAYGKANNALKEQGVVVSGLANKIAEFRKGLTDAINAQLKFTSLTSSGSKNNSPYKDPYEDPFKNSNLNFNFVEPIRLAKLAAKEYREVIKKELEQPISPKIKIKLPSPGTGLLDIDLKNMNDALEASIKDFLSSSAVDGLSSVGEALGSALSGGNLGDIFSGFADAIATGLQQLGKQFIKFGVLAKLAKDSLKTLFTNPFAAIAAGVALVAAGSALRGALGKGITGARAFGGGVSAGGSYLVGERGPELFTPGVSGNITPNNRLGVGGGSGRLMIAGELVARGRDLVSVLAYENRSQTRLA